MNLLTDRAGLKPSSRVLDIGCGTGRLAEPLARALSPEGAYTGFDVAWAGVEECRRRLAGRRPDFVFVHADLANTEYNASGRNSEQGYRFPAESSRVDVAVATSVFSHMRLESVAAYLAEAARVLAPEGRFIFTAYTLTTERRACSNLKPFGASSQVLDLSSPERMIAHDTDALEAAITAAGLQVLEREFGTWALGATYEGRQDLYVAVRA